jgi:hypothetical protein
MTAFLAGLGVGLLVAVAAVAAHFTVSPKEKP